MRAFGCEDVANCDRCVLNLFVARERGPLGLLRLAGAALLRRLGSAGTRGFEAICLESFEIAARGRRLPVSVDGEVVDMALPLRFSVRRGGLKVLMPLAGGGEGSRVKGEG